jgi:hypothetical protein
VNQYLSEFFLNDDRPEANSSYQVVTYPLPWLNSSYSFGNYDSTGKDETRRDFSCELWD